MNNIYAKKFNSKDELKQFICRNSWNIDIISVTFTPSFGVNIILTYEANIEVF